MSILILAPETDAHASAVLGHLRAIGRDAEVVDLSQFPQQISLEANYDCYGARNFSLCDSGRKIDLSAVRSAWWRRPQSPIINPAIASDRHRVFAMNECAEALAGLWHALEVFWVNDPATDHAAHRKLYQLRIAQEVGLRIPESTITNDPGAARVFIDRRGYRDVIYKSFSAMEDQWRETRLLKEDELSLVDNVSYAPVIFQQYIPAAYDVRLTVIGDQLFPAAIHSQDTDYPVDCRMDLENAAVEPIELPKKVCDKVRALMRRLGLVYGAIDLRLNSDNDEYVFLEINPAGQWLFIEERTGQPIGKALADILVAKDD